MMKLLVARLRSLPPSFWVVLGALTAGLLWSYWTTLGKLAARWAGDPQYSHGYLVPLFAAALLWLRRALLPAAPWQPNSWGFGVLAAGLAVRLSGGAFYDVEWLDSISLLPCLAGLCLLAGGWPALRWAWPAIVFLFFMMPLPYSLETAFAYRLRYLATVTSAYALETLGFPVLAEGTDIFLDDICLQIAPACSGLGMLVTFFALATAIILVIERPWVDKVIILASALPIAVLANIVRITLTASLYRYSAEELARKFFHDWSGFLMMPVALGLLWLELKILERLFVPVPASQPLALDLPEKVLGRRQPQVPGPTMPAR